MEDFLPAIFKTTAVVLALLFGIIVYYLSLIIGVQTAFFLAAGFFSLLLLTAIWLLVPNIDNKDAAKAIRQVIAVVFLADLLIILISLIKVFSGLL